MTATCRRTRSWASPESQARKLCELNVAVQVVHVRESPVLQGASHVKVHGWIHHLSDGLLRDLAPMVDSVRALEPDCKLPG